MTENKLKYWGKKPKMKPCRVKGRETWNNDRDRLQLGHPVAIDGLRQLKVYSRRKLKGTASTSSRNIPEE